MNETQNTPELRFEGFTEPWGQQKLGDVAEIVGGGTPDTSNPDYWDGSIDWYSPVELGDQIYADRSVRRITDEGYANCSAKMLPAGRTILFTSRAGIGNTAILRRPACTNQGFQSIVIHDDVDVYFLYTQSTQMKQWAEKKASGSTFLEISGKQLAEMPLRFPRFEEQEKIGIYFQHLDSFIAFQQRKYERLQHLKQALLRKMFPKPGEQVPELRFDGFTEPWKERKLGELSDEFEYGLNVPATAFDGNHKYLRITDIDNETHRFDMSNLTSPLADFEQCEQYRLREHDLLFARTGASVGKTYLYRPSDGLTYYAGFLIRAHIHDDVSSNFVFQSTLTERYRQFVTVTSQRSGQPGINAQEYSEFVIPVPSVSEQHAIGSLFSHMDSLITLYQRNYERLQHLKQALLRKMFV